jgi:integrase
MKRGSLKQNGKYWWFKYREFVTENGQTVRKDRQVKLTLIADHKPKADGSAPDSVRAMAVKYLAPINAGDATPLSADKFQSFLETFLAKGEGGRGRMLEASTIRNYNDLFKMVKPHLPNIELRQIRTPHIDKLLRDVAEADDANGGRRAHSQYVNLKNSFLNSAFRYAMRHGLVDVNPVSAAAIPEGKEADTHAYMLEEFHGMIKALDKEGADKNHVAEAAMVVAMFTGLRMEELKGLRWSDYDEKVGVLNVERAVVDGDVKDVKTKGSKAPVPVVKIVRDKLAEHLERNSGDGYIFHPEGDSRTPMRFENLSRRDIIPVLEKSKIEWYGWHAFRRGLSTQLQAVGCPDSIADAITRHTPKGKETRRKFYVKTGDPAVLKTSREWLRKVEARYNKIAKKKGR